MTTNQKKKPRGYEKFAPDELRESSSDFVAVLSLLKYGKGSYLKLFSAMTLIFLASGFIMGSAKVLGSLVEIIRTDSPIRNPEIMYLGLYILMFEVLYVVTTYYGRVGLAFVTNSITYNIRRELFRKTSTLPIAYFDNQPLGRTITRLTSDIDGIEKFFGSTLARVISATITIFAVFTAMILTSPYIGSMIVMSSVPAVIFTVILRKPVRHWLRVSKIRSSKMNSKLAEYINGFNVIKIFGLEKWSQSSFVASSNSLLASNLAMTNWNSFIRPVTAFLCSFPIVIILWWGGLRVIEGTLTIGLLVAYIRYSERFLRPIMTLSYELHIIQDAIASSERVQQMLDEKEEITVLGPSGEIRKAIEGHVKYHNVWMEYKQGVPVLKGVNFDVKRGMKIGLVGATGSGKTTTINMLPQLYPTLKGEIEIDGTPLSEWDRTSIRQQIGMVSQDIVMFRGTLRDNLVAATDELYIVDDKKLLESCHKTGLDLVLKKMKDGLDSLILDGGENLSMGERQLIAFTRMLIRDPSILILDEATANIDPEYEEIIQKAIEEVLKDRTCFVIAHRLNTILQCDHILVFDSGAIVEQGTHQELLITDGLYAKLAQNQLGLVYN